jgi:hypothetical protein
MHWLLALEGPTRSKISGLPCGRPRGRRPLFRFEGAPEGPAAGHAGVGAFVTSLGRPVRSPRARLERPDVDLRLRR